jgi:hypothetical protein
MSNVIKMIRVNNLQYNPNRDPQVYRRLPNEDFRIEADLQGSGTAQVTFEADGKTETQSINLPGKFDASVSFDSPASRVGTLTVDINGEVSSSYIRLDVMDHAWIG